MASQRIFLLGSERSGTNLLRVLLGNHSRVCAPPPIHLLDVFHRRPRWYFPHSPARRAYLADAVNRYVNHAFCGWETDVSKALSAPDFLPTSFIDVLDQVYRAKAEAEGCPVYFCKDNHLHHYAPALAARFPDAAFVYIYRDPRDQVLSWMKTPLFLATPWQAAQKWREDQEICDAVENFYGIPLLRVCYESLITDTRGVMTGLLAQLGLPVEEPCFQTRKDNREADRHVLWKNLNKPVNTDNRDKFLADMSPADIELVETVCLQQMQRLGYVPVTPARFDFGNRAIWKLREKWRKASARRQKKKLATGDAAVIVEKNNFVRSLLDGDLPD